MNDEAKWVIGIGLPILRALGGVVWAMLRNRIDRSEGSLKEALGEHRAALAKIEDRFEQWVRDKERFDHEFRHDEYAPAIQRINLELYPLVKQVEVREQEREKLREWKHIKADPYIGSLAAR